MGSRESSCPSAAPSTTEPGLARADREAAIGGRTLAVGDRERADARSAPPRVVIEAVEPEVDAGRFPIKRVVGERVDVRADLFSEGHDRVAGVVRHRVPGAEWEELRMEPRGNDRFGASFRVEQLGVHEYTVEAWVDVFGSWRHALERKLDAGLDVGSELIEGASLIEAAAARAAAADALGDASFLRGSASGLAPRGGGEEGVRIALSPALLETMQRYPDRSNATVYGRRLRVQVERERAARGAWYEFFPRSCASEPGRHGSLLDAEERVAYAAQMGFDVVYLPPIHPIGESHRKGKDNAPTAAAGDPGSPWAIGHAAGGHVAVHPDLGTIEDFDHLVARARELGVELALDLALQCSPDHPWVREHPEWFRHRPDGSIQYAENPPKRYQDIYPIDFESVAWQALWAELLEVVLFWVDHGIKIFRVDNPHTKPLGFWEWLIREVRERHPDVVFLAEAFTRPTVLRYLAKAGFSQSYTYFTWRNTKEEIVSYFAELTQTTVREYLRPNLFANTPDILPDFLQTGNRAAFQIRAALAATLAASWGIYGPPFELCVGEALPGREEYAGSEKYEIRSWDVRSPDSLRSFLTRLNRIRRENLPLLTHGLVRFLYVDNPQIVAYLRTAPEDPHPVLVVVNLDPNHVQSGFLVLPLAELGLASDRSFQVHDLVGDGRYLWQGERNYVQLDPQASPVHVFRLRRHVRTERDFDYYL